MKIFQLFENEQLNTEYDAFIQSLEDDFFVDTFNTPPLYNGILDGNLRVRPRASFEKFPVDIKGVNNTLDLSGSFIKSFENFPSYARNVIIAHCSGLRSMNTSRLTKIFRLQLTGLLGLKNLENSGQLAIGRLYLKNCPGITSFSGIETIQPILGDGKLIYVSVDGCNHIEDDPMNYIRQPVRFTFESTPEWMPIVNSIVSTHGTVEFKDLGRLFDRYQILEDHYRKGAASVIPLTKYFKSIKEPWRAGVIS